jgi:demethylmenaquinone methyltransferase/2-methoxy-6-polyprenyl-1,4-benzoquinol methylase
MPDMSRDYATRLRLAAVFTEPAVRRAIDALGPPPGSRGLDAGCGVGRQALWLAEAVGPGGCVTGVDISPANLAAARELAAETDLGDRVEFREGDLLRLPFGEDAFDWAWCEDTLWPGFLDPQAGIQELCRVVRPGGKIALLYWSSQTLLPGYPGLEARLNAAFAGTTTYLAKVAPHMQFLRALGWLEAAGVEERTARTFVAQAQAPLEPKMRASIDFIFDMFWGGLEAAVTEEDWALYQRLCSSDSPEYILHNTDYYCFATYSLFHGRTPRV